MDIKGKAQQAWNEAVDSVKENPVGGTAGALAGAVGGFMAGGVPGAVGGAVAGAGAGAHIEQRFSSGNDSDRA